MTPTDQRRALIDARKAFIEATNSAAGADDEFAAFKALRTTVNVSALLDDLEAAEKARDEAVKALDDAAASMETISRLAGKATYPNGDDTLMGTFPQVRGYAISRASAARTTLSHIKAAGREG